MISNKNLAYLNKKFKNSNTEEILEWIFENQFPDFAMTSSFQVSGVVLIYLIKKMKIDFPVYFIDTGYHFPETLEFKNRLEKEWNLNVIIIRSKISKKEQEKEYGKFLYNRNPDLCCLINKVEPLRELKRKLGVNAWISAIRRDQSQSRSDYKVFMKDPTNHIRIHPLINWTINDIWNFVNKRKIPFHPLYEKGYTSIGCFPPACTAKNKENNSEREGRWTGKKKIECGLHLDLKN